MTTTTAPALAAARSATDLRAILLTVALGLGLIFVAGFAGASALHDVTHDQRHAIAFPCH